MLYPDESHEEILERMDHGHARFLKHLRRERWPFFAFLIAWAIYICVIPFVYSPDLIMLLLGFLTLFYGQFLVVMNLD